jgi:hypothetical protein
MAISDSIFKSSAVGAITVAPSDANVVYVEWMGKQICDLIFLWTEQISNGGKTWFKSGLDKADAINIEVHPTDANIVFLCHG